MVIYVRNKVKVTGGTRMMIFTSPRASWQRWVMDGVLLSLLFVILFAAMKLGAGMAVPFSEANPPVVDLSPDLLPYYAGRSLLRMFLAFGASLIFTLIYGYTAAKSRMAGRILVPLLDVLQSVPVLGFLSATIAAFMALFPGSLLGVECASIFAIFTGQAWNMTFSFYHSLTTVPKELSEAAGMLRLNAWQRFRRLELPAAAMGLIWNGMMSFGGGWFFLAASEAITVLGQDIHLPGIGSYLAAAADAGDIRAMGYAMAVMAVMIWLTDFLFWRPIIVWGQRFKLELSSAEVQPESVVYDALQASRLVRAIWRWLLAPAGRLLNFLLDRLAVFFSCIGRTAALREHQAGAAHAGWLLAALVLVYVIWTPAREGAAMLAAMGWQGIGPVLWFGVLTWLRVMAAVALGALWTVPVGVWIGLHPRVASHLQPVVQFASAFPANMLFPFLTLLFVWGHIDFSYGSILLMMLGTQWYILFNVIAGASALPNELLEASSMLKLHGFRRWRTVILPGIFPQLVTGLVTASGGAWNASIVSEFVSWRGEDFAADGLGAYITQSTAAGNWPEIIVGLVVMCAFVVIFNRLVWQRLYQLSVDKYHLE